MEHVLYVKILSHGGHTNAITHTTEESLERSSFEGRAVPELRLESAHVPHCQALVSGEALEPGSAQAGTVVPEEVELSLYFKVGNKNISVDAG